MADEVATNRSDLQHRLQGYNNDSRTTFADIQRVLHSAWKARSVGNWTMLINSAGTRAASHQPYSRLFSFNADFRHYPTLPH